MVAITLLLVGVGERLAAISLLPVMVVAILYAGLDWKNLSVLVGAVELLVLETGVESLWQPAPSTPLGHTHPLWIGESVSSTLS